MKDLFYNLDSGFKQMETRSQSERERGRWFLQLVNDFDEDNKEISLESVECEVQTETKIKED